MSTPKGFGVQGPARTYYSVLAGIGIFIVKGVGVSVFGRGDPVSKECS